jgi:hypothetical protein
LWALLGGTGNKEVIMANRADFVKECNQLKDGWSRRNEKFKVWYDLLSFKDELKQENMESFVGNDPRAQYNLAMQLLASRPIPHKIPIETLGEDYIQPASELELFINNKAWPTIESNHRVRGKQGWLRDFTGMLLVTGWYSVFSYLDDNGIVAELWNPASVYQEWGESGLVKCAHIYTMSNRALKVKATLRGWPLAAIHTVPTGTTTLYDFWYMDGDKVMHTIFTRDNWLVDLDQEVDFTSIPIFTSPVGGLPDDGAIMGTEVWKETIGQSFLATNENVFKSSNKMGTFAQQLLRDTAQPRWFEQSRGGAPILKKEDIFKRGAIFRGTPEDSITALPMPPLPIELRSERLDLEAMQQRGGLPWSLSGAETRGMTAYVMAQVESSAQQVIGSFHEAQVGLLGDLDNHWIDLMKRKGYQPYGFKLPKLPGDVKMSAEYEVEVPGSIIQKATVSRMLDPTFSLSTTTVMELMWPEIKNPIKEQARARKDLAEQHPVMATLSLIDFLLGEANRMERAGAVDNAARYRKVAAAAEATLTPPAEGAPPTRAERVPAERGLRAGTRAPVAGARTEAAPPSETMAPETLTPIA